MIEKAFKKIIIVCMLLMSVLATSFATDVTFNTNVDDVGIYENGSLIGTTVNNTLVLNLTDEEHLLTLEKEYYEPLNVTVNPLNDSEVNATLEEIEYLLTLNSNVDNVAVFDLTNNVSVGTFDNGFNILLTHGDYQLQLSKTNYVTQIFNVSIPADTEINVTLVVIEEETPTVEETDDDEEARAIILISSADDDSVITKLTNFFSNNIVVSIVLLGAIVGILAKMCGVLKIKGL